MILLPDRSRHCLVEPGSIRGFFGAMRFLSNFHPASVDIGDGLDYPTSEHAYMAQKTTDMALRAQICALPAGRDAKAFGQTLALRPGWDALRADAMRQALESKFSPALNPGLAQALADTAGFELREENNWGDLFWGCSADQGANRLGQELMRIRQSLLDGGFAPSRPWIPYAQAAEAPSGIPALAVYAPSLGCFCALPHPDHPLPEPAPDFGEFPPLRRAFRLDGAVCDGFFLAAGAGGASYALYRERQSKAMCLMHAQLFFSKAVPAGPGAGRPKI